MRRLLGAMLGLVMLSACTAPPRPFEHDDSRRRCGVCRATRSSSPSARRATCRPEMGQRVAAALAMELQAYGIVAAVQPADAPIQVNGTMSTRDAEPGHRNPDRLAHRRRAQDPGSADQPHQDAAGGLRRGQRTAGLAHRPAGSTTRRHPDRQAAHLHGALARAGRGRHERADGDAGRSGDGDGDGGRVVRRAAACLDPAIATTAAGSRTSR